MRSHGSDAAAGTVRFIVARPKRRIRNVPAEVTSFVGRRRELAEIRRALVAARLVSLVGPGGVGKTRLAVRTAADHQRGFPDGVWFNYGLANTARVSP
jgi:MoxR-like ATPase